MAYVSVEGLILWEKNQTMLTIDLILKYDGDALCGSKCQR